MNPCMALRPLQGNFVWGSVVKTLSASGVTLVFPVVGEKGCLQGGLAELSVYTCASLQGAEEKIRATKILQASRGVF